jgi:glutathione S-transferase
MALEVFWGSGSTPAWRVLLTLAVKNIPYESRLLQFSNRETQTPEFLSVNPRGKVPAIRDGSFTLYESAAIMAYLDRKHPSPPIFGETPEETGIIWRALLEHDNYFFPAVQSVVRPILNIGPPSATDPAEDKSAAIREASGAVHTELARLEEALAKSDKSDWIAGSRISAADLSVHTSLQLLLRAAAKPIAVPLDLGFAPLAQRYPKLAALSARIEALPGYDKTYPPHWREG